MSLTTSDSADVKRALDGIWSAVGLLGALTGRDDMVGVVARNELRFAADLLVALPRTPDLIAALKRIEKWFGEFPDTGRFWDEPENTSPMSYSACYGSNGERDYMREVARAALAKADWPLPQCGGSMSEWQPIETALKGVKVIAGYWNALGEWRSIMARYYHAGTLETSADYDFVDHDGYAPEGWYEESETHDNILQCDPLTHWMPLPESPQ